MITPTPITIQCSFNVMCDYCIIWMVWQWRWDWKIRGIDDHLFWVFVMLEVDIESWLLYDYCYVSPSEWWLNVTDLDIEYSYGEREDMMNGWSGDVRTRRKWRLIDAGSEMTKRYYRYDPEIKRYYIIIHITIQIQSKCTNRSP